MVRRRSMALSAAGGIDRLSVSPDQMGSNTLVASDGGEREKRWSDASFGGYHFGDQTQQGQTKGSGGAKRSSILKEPVHGPAQGSVEAQAQLELDEEERLDAELRTARRNSRDHVTMHRAS